MPSLSNLERVHSYEGTFAEYIECAEEIADEKQLPVLVEPPYRRKFLVFPIEATHEETLIKKCDSNSGVGKSTLTVKPALPKGGVLKIQRNG